MTHTSGWAAILSLILVLGLVPGCGVQPVNGMIAMNTDAKAGDVGDGDQAVSHMAVRWVFTSPPIPSGTVSRPLFGDRDAEHINRLLHWLRQAQKTDEPGLVSPLHGRSTAVEFVFEDGNTLQVRPAWNCETKTLENGNQETGCHPVDNRIAISGSSSDGYFAVSADLYDLVFRSHNEWMPQIQPFVLPDHIAAGQSFQIHGGGWMAEKVVVSLSRKNQVIWHQDAAVDHGEFHVTDTIPQTALPEEGDYDIEIKGVPFPDSPFSSSTYGTMIKVSF